MRPSMAFKVRRSPQIIPWPGDVEPAGWIFYPISSAVRMMRFTGVRDIPLSQIAKERRHQHQDQQRLLFDDSEPIKRLIERLSGNCPMYPAALTEGFDRSTAGRY